MTEKEKQEIKELYLSGLTYKEVRERTGRSFNTITIIVRGLRTKKEASFLSRGKGRYKISEEGRLKLSENGKKSCQKTGKIWTKPEREFKLILNELGLGVKFPSYIKEIYSLQDDENAFILFQYPIQRYVCDFVEIEKKIIFKVNGDFWHANPLLYDKNNLTLIQKHNVKQDMNSKIFFEKQGWLVVEIWESEIYWNKNIVKDKIRAIGLCGKSPALHTGNTQSDSEIAHLGKDWSERLKELWFKKPKGRPLKDKEKILCQYCKNVILNSNKKYCSLKCEGMDRRKTERPSKERLLEMIKNMTIMDIGRKFKVGDNTIRKWAKSYNIEYRHVKKKFYCKDCGKELSSNYNRCILCSQVNSRIIKNRPDIKILRKQVEEQGYSKTGKLYKVSGGTIKRWVK